ncbi:MAG: pentapeptide repeat-containing protein [Owenweeksia sp.]
MLSRNHLYFTLFCLSLPFSFTLKAQTGLDKHDPANKAIAFLKKEKTENQQMVDSAVALTPAFFLHDSLDRALTKPLQPLDKFNLAGEDLSYLDLSGMDLSRADLRYTTMIKTNLSGTNLEGSNLTGAIMEGANLSGANLQNTTLTHTFGTNIKAEKTDFTNAKFKEAYWPYAEFDKAVFYGTLMHKANFNGAIFQDLKLTNAFMDSSIFWGTSFVKVHFERTRVYRSKFIGSSFMACYLDNSKFNEAYFHENLLAQNAAFLNQFNSCFYGLNPVSVYDLNLLSGDWLEEITKLSMGFTSVEGITIHYPKPESIQFDHEEIEKLYRYGLVKYLIATINSIRYWSIIADLNNIVKQMQAISHNLTSQRFDGLTFWVDQNGTITTYKGHPVDVARRIMKEELKMRLIKPQEAPGPQPTHTNTGSGTGNGNGSQTDLDDLYDEQSTRLIGDLGYNGWACVAINCFSRRFESDVFNDVGPLTDVFNVDYFIEAAELIAQNQDEIIMAARNRELDLNTSSLFRARETHNNTINHAIGAVDFSLRGEGLIDDPAEKRRLSEELSDELGTSHLVILEELYWVEKGMTIHQASDALRREGRNNYENNRPGNPPPTLPSYSAEVPGNSATIIQINSYYLNGEFVRSEWGKPWASAQHIHVQLENPEVFLPEWARKTLNDRWEFFRDRKTNEFDEDTRQKLAPFYPKRLYTPRVTVEDNPWEEYEDNYFYQLFDSLIKTDPIPDEAALYKMVKSRLDTSLRIKINENEIFIGEQLLSDSVHLTHTDSLIGPYITQYNGVRYPFQRLSAIFNYKTELLSEFSVGFYLPFAEKGREIPFSAHLIINGIDFTRSKDILGDLRKAGFVLEDPDAYYPTYNLETQRVYVYAEYDEDYGTIGFSFGYH